MVSVSRVRVIGGRCRSVTGAWNQCVYVTSVMSRHRDGCLVRQSTTSNVNNNNILYYLGQWKEVVFASVFLSVCLPDLRIMMKLFCRGGAWPKEQSVTLCGDPVHYPDAGFLDADHDPDPGFCDYAITIAIPIDSQEQNMKILGGGLNSLSVFSDLVY